MSIETKEQFVEKQLKRFRKNGYNPVHIFGDWYFVRHKSRNYTKVSYYILHNMSKNYIKNSR